MKWSLMTVITLVLPVGCKSLDNSLIQAAKNGNIEAAKQAIDDGELHGGADNRIPIDRVRENFPIPEDKTEKKPEPVDGQAAMDLGEVERVETGDAPEQVSDDDDKDKTPEGKQAEFDFDAEPKDDKEEVAAKAKAAQVTLLSDDLVNKGIVSNRKEGNNLINKIPVPEDISFSDHMKNLSETIPEYHKAVSYTHLTLPTNREV